MSTSPKVGDEVDDWDSNPTTLCDKAIVFIETDETINAVNPSSHSSVSHKC